MSSGNEDFQQNEDMELYKQKKMRHPKSKEADKAMQSLKKDQMKGKKRKKQKNKKRKTKKLGLIV